MYVSSGPFEYLNVYKWLTRLALMSLTLCTLHNSTCCVVKKALKDFRDFTEESTLISHNVWSKHIYTK